MKDQETIFCKSKGLINWYSLVWKGENGRDKLVSFKLKMVAMQKRETYPLMLTVEIGPVSRSYRMTDV